MCFILITMNMCSYISRYMNTLVHSTISYVLLFFICNLVFITITIFFNE
jgi:hypothetical protein